jgi:hypothetical protein
MVVLVVVELITAAQHKVLVLELPDKETTEVLTAVMEALAVVVQTLLVPMVHLAQAEQGKQIHGQEALVISAAVEVDLVA